MCVRVCSDQLVSYCSVRGLCVRLVVVAGWLVHASVIYVGATYTRVWWPHLSPSFGARRPLLQMWSPSAN